MSNAKEGLVLRLGLLLGLVLRLGLLLGLGLQSHRLHLSNAKVATIPNSTLIHLPMRVTVRARVRGRARFMLRVRVRVRLRVREPCLLMTWDSRRARQSHERAPG